MVRPLPMPRGHLTVHTGPMFSGKTTALLTHAARYDTVAAFIPAVDDRYEEGAITSHAGSRLEATVLPPENPEAILNAVEAETAVVVDEAQFFADTLVAVLEELRRDGRAVLAAGLTRDFRAEPFPPMPRILARADIINHHTAQCDTCGRPASRTQRLVDGDPAPRTAPTVDVAGKERYEARCTTHHVVPDA